MKTFILSLAFLVWTAASTVDSHAQHVTRSYTDTVSAGTQNNQMPVSDKRNSIRISWMLTKGCFSYERVLKKHLSVGGLCMLDGGFFSGAGGAVFGRFYFTHFNKSGFFLEAKSGYMRYTRENVYSSYSYTYKDGSQYALFDGGHTAHIECFSNTFSIGGNLYCNESLYFSAQMGYRMVSVSYGKDDIYYAKHHLFSQHDEPMSLHEQFESLTMPGSNIQILFHIGVVF